MRIALAVIVLMLVLAGCAEPAPGGVQPGAPGFLYGLAHGFLLLFTFIASFFADVAVYATPNNGWPYDLGFLIGVMVFFGGSAGSARR
ncbi:MAG: hypothetical protein JJU18_11520 [Oceanicaulis sp.]|nr:hypothetical protein [Oceanicaulis sp.]